ncbi:glycosyltransferase [Thozetella sp. PMI_491]|nr:glycosyltransferase [Thozetella sp. PMI_491]
MAAPYSPPEGLTVIPGPDPRTDDEIVSVLATHQPVTSDKNVWAFWHSGWEGLRPWSQRNVINWVRRLGPEWTVRVLDDVAGSENHLSKFVPDSYFPEAFNTRTMVGPPQHVSDLLRLPLLYIHGGVWMDAGMTLFRHLDDICWRAIEDPSSPYEMAGILMPLRPEPGTMLNGFIATKRGNEVVKRWHDVYCKMWEGKTSAEGFSKHPLLAHLSPLETQIDKLGCPPLLLPTEALGDYLAHFLAFERLHHLKDPSDGFDGADYHANKILLLRAEDHLYYAQRITGWDGRKQYNMLATKVSADPVTTEGYAEAKLFVDSVLQNSVMMKLSHGPPCGLENLASIWDEEQHKDDDVAEGTFASYLRYGSVHWQQSTPITPVRLEKYTQVYTAGVLEPITPESQ